MGKTNVKKMKQKLNDLKEKQDVKKTFALYKVGDKVEVRTDSGINDEIKGAHRTSQEHLRGTGKQQCEECGVRIVEGQNHNLTDEEEYDHICDSCIVVNTRGGTIPSQAAIIGDCITSPNPYMCNPCVSRGVE